VCNPHTPTTAGHSFNLTPHLGDRHLPLPLQLQNQPTKTSQGKTPYAVTMSVLARRVNSLGSSPHTGSLPVSTLP
jgi:hypothetical protein